MVHRLKRVGKAVRGRLKSSALVGLVLLSVVASTGAAFLNTSTAHAAAAGVYYDPTLVQKIKAYVFAEALAACVSGGQFANSGGVITTQQLISGNWFGTNSSAVGVTHLFKQDNGTYECQTASFVLEALTAQGFDPNNTIAAACQLGAKRDNGSDCFRGNGDLFDIPTNTGTVIGASERQRATIFNGDKVANLTPEMKYLIAAGSVELGCLATPELIFASATPNDKASVGPGGNDHRWTMRVVNADSLVATPPESPPGTTNTIYQSASHTRTNEQITTYSDTNNHNITKNCLELATEANNFAAAYVAYLKLHPPPAGTGNGSGSGSSSTCDSTNGAGGLAGSTDFVLCPTTASVIDSTNSLAKLISGFLTVSPLATSSVIYELWKSFRDLANVLLVMLFFAIIFSQATSIGISNYGIKKVLPKLVLVAIGANLSFFLVAFVIDSFNIMGGGLIALTDTTLHNANISTGASATDIWAGVGLGVLTLALTAHLYHSGLLRIIGPIIGIGFLAVLLFFIMLALRQMIIILLVVVAAPAIVLSLLPGTESYFKKWWGLLLKMLIMYPIVVLILIASSVAGNILGQA
ncbi:MAG TPA: hypothetical protein VNX65_02745 [Patescibacteria group bacterium]|jgi:hypothetical protein|nr:hypothetical protein [Patescibacteria group bacterium]